MLYPNLTDLETFENLPTKVTNKQRLTKTIYENRESESYLFENIFEGLVKKYGTYSIVLSKLKNHSRLRYSKKHKKSLLYLKEMIGYTPLFTKGIDWNHLLIKSSYYLQGDLIKPIQEHPDYLSKVKYSYYLNDKTHLHVIDQFDMYNCICFYLGCLYFVEFKKDYIDYLYNKTSINNNLIGVGFNVELSVKNLSLIA